MSQLIILFGEESLVNTVIQTAAMDNPSCSFKIKSDLNGIEQDFKIICIFSLLDQESYYQTKMQYDELLQSKLPVKLVGLHKNRAKVSDQFKNELENSKCVLMDQLDISALEVSDMKSIDLDNDLQEVQMNRHDKQCCCVIY